jgi:hypothetical protein
MRACRHLLTIVALACCALLLSACPVPIGEEAPFEEKAPLIEAGKTTRLEVLGILGAPDITRGGDAVFAYAGSQAHMAFILATYGGLAGFAVGDYHLLVIEFDDDGVAEHVELIKSGWVGKGEGTALMDMPVCTSTDVCFARGEFANYPAGVYGRTGQALEESWERETRAAELEPKALGGDADAQYELAHLTTDAEMRWAWLCRAAHGGHLRARRWMGAGYLTGVRDSDEPDHVRAYLWYGLAASEGDPQSDRALRSLAGRLSMEERETAERLIDGWRPNPKECDAPHEQQAE